MGSATPSAPAGLFVVIYDHPHDEDVDAVRIVSAWSERVVSEEVEWGLIDHDATTDEVVAVEIWAAGKRVPQAILDALPRPGGVTA